MTTVNKYRVWCSTDSKHEYVWGEVAPTTCPADTGHTIDSSKTSIVEVLQENEVVIQEEATKTGGHYQASSFEIDVGAGDSTKEKDVSFPFPISMLAAEWNNEAAFDGDDVEFLVGKNTTIGTITAAVAASDEWIEVSATVMENVRVGGVISVYDGTNTNELGRCLEIDTVNDKIKVETAATQAFAVATPTYVRQTVELLRKGPLCGYGRVQLGESKIGGSRIPANTVLKAIYHNTNATPKKMRFTLEYLY